jgi:mycoredoxin-dependent peroxiredoxin
LRQDYEEFTKRNAEIITVGPDPTDKMQQLWEKEQLPFPGVADPDTDVLESLGQDFKILKFGRMPAVVVIGSDGEVRHAHYGSNAGDIPENAEVLAILDELPQSPEMP